MKTYQVQEIIDIAISKGLDKLKNLKVDIDNTNFSIIQPLADNQTVTIRSEKEAYTNNKKTLSIIVDYSQDTKEYDDNHSLNNTVVTLPVLNGALISFEEDDNMYALLSDNDDTLDE